MADSTAASTIIVAGPTASGKSSLAAALAGHFDGVVINGDSQQVYRGLAILTACPGPDVTALVPHRLYGVIDPSESCSAGRWLKLALAEIASARETGRLPIIAGGTGLYIEALLKGLTELPPIAKEAREEARSLRAKLGPEGFRAALAELDPEAAARLPTSDTQRLIRAYEVARATGLPLSEWHRRQEPPPAGRNAAVVLLPPRDELYAACDARVSRMIEDGAEAEVKALLARHLAPDLPAMKALGLRELAAWLEGRQSRAEAIVAMQQATRNYAKRQYTWFRRRLAASNLSKTLVLNAQFSERMLPEIFAFIRQFLLTESV